METWQKYEQIINQRNTLHLLCWHHSFNNQIRGGKTPAFYHPFKNKNNKYNTKTRSTNTSTLTTNYHHLQKQRKSSNKVKQKSTLVHGKTTIHDVDQLHYNPFCWFLNETTTHNKHHNIITSGSASSTPLSALLSPISYITYNYMWFQQCTLQNNCRGSGHDFINQKTFSHKFTKNY